MTIDEAVDWMAHEFEIKRLLYQEEAASYFLTLNDERIAYFDLNGNLCLSKEVLKRFRARTPNIVYERAEKFWRDRLDTDQPGRQQ